MRSLYLGLFLLICHAQEVFAQGPTISVAVNAASNLPPGLPNSGIAQGALMIIYGTNLGPSTLSVVPAYPIPTTLAGTSVQITSLGRSIDALMYYTSATQVAAIVPSTTPLGPATVAVTYNGRVSAFAQIAIVQNNVGLYTVNSQGTSNAVVTFSDYSYVTPSNAANPGETVVLWANGLGPITTDDSQLPKSADMTNVPLEVFIGGKSAKVLFHGRNSCCASLDQINVLIPNIAVGCRTAIVMKIGTQVSNTVTFPTTATGRTCTTNDASTTTSDFQALTTKSTATLGQIALLRSNITTTGVGNAITTSQLDAGSAIFYKYVAPYSYAVGDLIDSPSPGSCTISVNQSGGAPAPATQFLDAGESIAIVGPNGVRAFAKQAGPTSIAYSNNLGANYLDAGQYTLSAPGGPSAGSFSASLNFPRSFVWVNQASSLVINRSNGATVTWVSDGSGFVQISGQSIANTSASSSVAVRFDCVAQASDGSFTLPPVVLLALPPTASTSLGTLTVGNVNNHVPFKATGIDHGYIYFGINSLNLGIVTYQ